MKPKAMTLIAAILLIGSVLLFALNIYMEGGANEEDSFPNAPQVILRSPDIAEPAGKESSSEIAGELVTQISQWTESLLSSPGWLYVKERVLQANMELGVLPDGKPVPEDYIFESWYLLDSNGFVVSGISRMLDMHGYAIQTSIYENYAWTNLTYDFTSPSESFKPNLDHGLSLDIGSVGTDRITSFDEREIVFYGKPALEVTTHEVFVSPVSLGGIEVKIERIIKRAVLDRDSGALVSYETIYRTENGNEVRISLVTILAAGRVESPPPDVLSLLQEVH
jgi:hypothetical protein